VQLDLAPNPGTEARVDRGGTIAVLGKILRDEIRESDLIAQLGDSRFCLLLPFTDGGSSMSVGERLRSRVENHSFQGEAGVQRTVSVSVACYPTNASDSTTLLCQADETLLRAVDVGGNRVTYAD